ncbi:MAG: hypothetical protein K8R02_03325 [Anaerohalosphaeraceae bacterium]|nr:hypothetical protein [Anaerohalosphaeraceae bacterium]
MRTYVIPSVVEESKNDRFLRSIRFARSGRNDNGTLNNQMIYPLPTDPVIAVNLTNGLYFTYRRLALPSLWRGFCVKIGDLGLKS